MNMDGSKFTAFLLLLGIFFASSCVAIQHARNLIWAQTPALRLTVSRLVGIEGDPLVWVPAKSPSVKHIGAPHYGWEFKGLGFNYRKQLLVWSEAMNKKIQALYLNGSTETIDIYTGTSSEVHGVGVDWASNNVYWTDALYNWILMAPLKAYSETDRVYRIIVQEGLDNPHGLALVPSQNKLFLSDWGVRPRIEQMDLLGRNRKVLVDDDMVQPRGLALDIQRMTLYWVDSAKATIESVSLRPGAALNRMRQVNRIDSGSRFFDLAVFGDYVFATEQSQGLLKVFTLGSDEDPVSFTLDHVPYGIIMYDEDQQPGPFGDCDSLGCEHMCVEEPKTGARCLCGEGFDLDDSGKRCILRKQFTHPSHLYAIGVAICLYPAHIADMSLDNVSLTSQCFLTDRFGYLALTFDAAENLLYYSGNYTNTISVIPLETGAKANVVASGTGTVRGLALDWVAGTIYWTDSTNAYIKTARKDGRFQRVLLEEDVNNPLGIAVHPARGKIYWTDIGFQPDVLPKIESANMDGSEREILLKDNLGQPNHLLIDYTTDKLYWADSILNHIRQYDLNDRSMIVFFEQPKVKFYGLSLYKDYVLWTDTEDMNGIHVARLDTKRKVRGIIHPNYGIAADLITFDSLNQPSTMTSPCNSSKQCAQLCLPRGAQAYTCACGLGFQLTDQTNCTIGSVSRDGFLLVSDPYQRNIYHVDGRKGHVTAMSQGEVHEPIALGYHPPPADRLYWSDNTAHVLRRKPLGLGPAENFVGLPEEHGPMALGYPPPPSDRLYWSDNTAHVLMRKPLGLGPAENFVGLPEDSVVDGIAIDHLNNLLFYTDTGRDLIGVVSTSSRPPRHATIVREGMDEPRAIVVSSADAKIYWTDWGINASINVAHMNGDEPKVLHRFNQTAWPNGLAIDNKERVLYWADANANKIGMYQLDTGHHRLLLIEPQAHYFGLFLMGDFLYVTDWKRSFVGRIHKQGGQLMQFGEAKFTKLYGITGYNSTDTARGGTGICANQTRCSNVSLCVPHALTSFSCVCIQGYQMVGPRCQRVITTTTPTPTKTSTPTTTTTTTTTTSTTSNKSQTPTTTRPRVTIDHSDVNKTAIGNNSDSDFDHKLEGTSIGPDGRESGGSSDNNNSGGGESGSANQSGKNGDSGKDGGARHGENQDTSPGNSSHLRTGILVAAVVGSVAVLLAAVLAAYFYFRRRRGYQVPHTRLNEERGRKGSRGSSSPSSTIASINSGSISKVTYARHNSNDSVHFDEGFENPTYDVTMAMLTEEQPPTMTSFGTKA